MKLRTLIQIIFLFFTISFFVSCVYKTNELTEIEVAKPDSYHPIDIKLNPEQDSILIFETTNFTFDVNTFGNRFNAADVHYLGINFQIQNENGSFNISPNFNDKRYSEWFDLKIDFYISTGTGSIADKLGLENYVGSKTWKVKFFNMTNYDFKFNHRVGADSLLEFYWIKPQGLDTKVITNDRLKITRLKKDTVFYTDSTFIGGRGWISFYFNMSGYSWKTYHLEYEYPRPTFKVTNIGLDSCLLSWYGSPFKISAKLFRDSELIYAGHKNEIYDTQPKIGKTTFYDFACFGYSKLNYEYGADYYSYYTNATGIKTQFNICYAKDLDLFYLSYKNGDPKKLETSGYPLTYRLDQEEYRSPFKYFHSTPAGDLKVSNSFGQINVFGPDNQVLSTFDIGYSDFSNLTQNGLFSYLGSQLFIKNLNPNSTWTGFSFKPHYNDSTKYHYIGGIAITEDGNYVGCRGDYDFYLYDIRNKMTAEVVYQSKDIFAMIGNPLNYNEVICKTRNKIEVCHLPDMNPLRSFDATGMEDIIFQNIDPYSGILLFTTKENLIFVDINSMKEVFRLPADLGWSTENRLYRKQLFIKNGYHIDLSKYLP